MSDVFPADYFRRQDESDDFNFYAEPRKVVHIDDAAIATLKDFLREHLPRQGALLDLMSSWRSHLPDGVEFERVVGLGMNQSEMLVSFAEAVPVDCLLLAGRYKLLDKGALAALFPLCQAKHIGILLGGLYNSGILANPTTSAKFNYQDADAALVARALELDALCRKHGTELKAAALQFCMAHPAVTVAVMGARNGWERPLYFVPEGAPRGDRPTYRRPDWLPYQIAECAAWLGLQIDQRVAGEEAEARGHPDPGAEHRRHERQGEQPVGVAQDAVALVDDGGAAAGRQAGVDGIDTVVHRTS